MKRRLGLLVFCTICCLYIVQGQTITSLPSEQNAWLAKANRHEKSGWIYLHIEGAPHERGFQHGFLMAREVKEAIRVLSIHWTYQSAMEWSWLVERAHDILTTKVDSENLAEIDGIRDGMQASGISTTRDELVTLNGWMELLWYWWPSVKNSFRTQSSEPTKQSCSSFIATGSMTVDGGIVLGHNTMLGYQVPVCNVLLDIVPEKGHRIFMQSVAGFVHSGTDFFVSDAGLVGSETTIADFFPFDPNGVPEFARMRHATQYASTIDEWCETMKKKNNGGLANTWLLGDINTNEIARLELGLKYVGFERTTDGYFTGSNLVENPRILRFETTEEETNIKRSQVARRVRWKQLMTTNKGKIDLELAKAFEADHYDTYLNVNAPGGRTLCAHWDLDPATAGVSEPFHAGGTLDAKVVNSKMAKRMSFFARWGSACGTAFDARKFLEDHPQYDWMSGILKDRPSEPWVECKAGER